jgi:hypothetical protein
MRTPATSEPSRSRASAVSGCRCSRTRDAPAGRVGRVEDRGRQEGQQHRAGRPRWSTWPGGGRPGQAWSMTRIAAATRHRAALAGRTTRSHPAAGEQLTRRMVSRASSASSVRCTDIGAAASDPRRPGRAPDGRRPRSHWRRSAA